VGFILTLVAGSLLGEQALFQRAQRSDTGQQRQLPVLADHNRLNFDPTACVWRAAAAKDLTLAATRLVQQNVWPTRFVGSGPDAMLS